MKKYSIIYSDPPWKFGSRACRSGRYKNLDYKTMTVKEIAALNIKSMVEHDAALFLWAPSAFIIPAGQVITAWGFKYIRVDSVWEKLTAKGKKHKVAGAWGMNEAEFLLMGTRGSICNKQLCKRNLETIVSEKYPGRHSKKPDIFRDRIDYRFGNLQKIELFARKKTPGWDVWGDEVKSDIDMEYYEDF